MKIAIVGPTYPFRGGIAQFAAQLSQELSTQHEVLCLNFKNQYPSIIFPGKTQFDESKKYINVKNKRLLTPYNLFTFSSSASALYDFKPDLVIFNYWIPITAFAYCFLARQMKRNLKTRILTICHNLESHEKWFMVERLLKTALKYSDEIVTLSDSVAQKAIRLFSEKKLIHGFHPIYNCYNFHQINRDSARAKLNLSDKKVILFFGYIKPYKGLELLLNAFPMILKNLPEAHLLIVGEVYGEDRVYFDLIETLKIQDKVDFHNKFVKNEEVEIFFKAADVLALPYLTATQSGVVQIAYDFGLGAVCTPVGGLPELVINNKTGCVAKDISEEAFTEAIIEYFKIDQASLKKNIETENKKYSWQKFTELILS